MATTSRVLLVAGALLASASLAQAGDKGAFSGPTRDERVDLAPIAKDAPATAAAPEATAVAAAEAPAVVAPSGRRKAARGRTRLERHAAKAVAAAALKATFPTAPADPAKAPPASDAVATAGDGSTRTADSPTGRTEAAAPLPPSAPAPAALASSGPREAPSATVAELLEKHARANGVPLALAKAVVTIESRGNVRASHAGALGLMQIKYGTARAAGFGGPAVGLFAADTNLRFGMKILGDAYRAAGGDTCGALMRYQSGHLATHMNRANRAYCSKARALMAHA